jgi:hypothetical protein
MTKSVVQSGKVAKFKWMRERRQLSGKVYYYLEMPGFTPRQEFSLGDSLPEAIRRREEILFRHFQSQQLQPIRRVAVLDAYLQIKVPISASIVKAENVRTIQWLSNFFSEDNHESLSVKAVDEAYQKWRGPRHSLRAKREVSFLKKILAWWYLRMQQMSNSPLDF